MFVKLYLIGLARLWWMRDIISHDTYDWFLDALRASPEDIFESPFLE